MLTSPSETYLTWTFQSFPNFTQSGNSVMDIPRLPLNDGTSMPMLGFGTGTAWFKDGGKGPLNHNLINILKTALDKGFLHIDGAEAYGTEEEIGIAVKESQVPRKNLFITTKVLDGIRGIPSAIDASLKKLQMDYVDLYMIHHPYWAKSDAELQQAWLAMEKVKESGKAKSIGICNYIRPHVEVTLNVASIVPSVNQIEFHPYLQRANDYVPWLKSKGIEVAAFKPLVPITVGKGGPLDTPLTEIAERHRAPINAVLLDWAMQQNITPITTTTKEERLGEYAKAVSLSLPAEEMEEISQIGLTHHFRAWGKQRFDPNDRT